MLQTHMKSHDVKSIFRQMKKRAQKAPFLVMCKCSYLKNNFKK